MLVRTADNKQYTAKVVDINPSKDTAHLRIEPKPGETPSFPFLKLRERTTDLRRGDLLVALGHPQELPRTFMAPGTYLDTRPVGEQGIVPVEASGRNNLLPLIAASMHVEGGNSGGPVVDKNGEVVGLTSSGNRSTDQIVPAETIRRSFALRTQPMYPSFIPHEFAWGAKATMLATEGVIIGGTRMISSARPVGLVAPIIGAMEFSFQDLTPLVAAYHSGTTAEKVSACVNVLGDVLMMGSTVAASRGYGLATALTGLGLKLANNVGDRQRFLVAATNRLHRWEGPSHGVPPPFWRQWSKA